MIHICYGLYDRDGHYSKFVGTSITSICENTKEQLMIHILHDNTLTKSNLDKINYVANYYDQQIKFYNVEALVPDKVEEMKQKLPKILASHYSIATLYRLLLPELMKDKKKILYIDADTIINRDIKDLWNFNIEQYPLAALPEIEAGSDPQKIPMCAKGFIKAENYFNAGVLILNLDYLRKNEDLILSGYDVLNENPEFMYFDQDILNHCFSENYLKLTKDFNCFVFRERERDVNEIGAMIYHYLFFSLKLDANDVFNRLFFNYFKKTPWFDIDVFTNIHHKVAELYDDRQRFLLHTIIGLEGKKRSYFLGRNNFEAIKSIFAVKSEDALLDANQPNALNNMIDKLKKHKGKIVFLIFVDRYTALRNILLQLNFVEGRDFMNGMEFLPMQFRNTVLDTNFIVRAM